MQFKHRLAYIALGCVLLSSGILLFTNLRAQTPKQAQIAFVSNRDGNNEIYVMDADVKNQRNLTNNPADDWRAAWSPDGRRIAFGSNRDGNGEIYVMDADGNHPRRLTKNAVGDVALDWSPDGQRIAFTSFRDGNWEIYVMDADGKNQRRLTNNPADDYSPDWFDPAFAYAVSPAGKLRGTWGWLKQTSK